MIFGVLINNVFNELDENNGYTWDYIASRKRVLVNFYSPQAGRNFMARVLFKF